jgi:beta-glucosidase
MFIGYRWYDARRQAVMFPFGFGLSYTSFRYGDARVSSPVVGDAAEVMVTVDVTNTGERAGSEVVQVYVRHPAAGVPRPDKELRGFAKVLLEPGETRAVEIRLDPRAFSFWDPRRHGWLTQPGPFEVLVGSSAADIHSSITVTVVATGRPPSTLSDMSPLDDWLRDQVARGPTIGLLQELAPILGGAFGEAAQSVDALDPHFHNYFGTMPIRGVLEFAEPAGGPDPDVRLAELSGAVGRGADGSESTD